MAHLKRWAKKPHMDWIYRHVYEFALRSPSKKTADDAAAMFVGLAVAMHILFAMCLLDWWAHTGVQKGWVVSIAIACIAASFYYYGVRKNGVRVIESAKKEKKRTHLWIAAFIFVEVIFLPLWMAPVFILLSRLSK